MGNTEVKEVPVYVPAPAPPPEIQTVIKYVEVPAPPPPPTPMFDQPWREIDWGNNDDLLMLNEYTPGNPEVDHLRFLVYGPVGSGKSSFINSVTTALLGRMAIPTAVNTSDSAETSFTLQYKTHRIRRNHKGYYPFVFNDIMGLERDQNVGVRAEDIKLAMMGHVKDGYKFNPRSSLSKSDSHYNPNPSPNDKVHVLVLILSANCPEINPSVIQKMKEVRETARDLGIPQIAIGTHIDEVCDEIKQDVKNIYKSKDLKTKMTEFSNAVGIPLNCIMGVKNYSEGKTRNDKDMDTLILIALKHMVDFGDDFIREMSGDMTEDEPPPTPSPPTPLLDKPWRKINWGKNEVLLKELEKYSPEDERVNHLRFLVYGPVGAGKSSFINSVTTALLGRMAIPAAVNTSESAEKSFTLKYETHQIRKGQGAKGFYSFVFNDIMGLERDKDVGVQAEDIKLAMKGHVKDGYKFNPVSPLSESDPEYNPDPSPDDMVHVLVLLLSANCSEINPFMIQKMKEVRETARDLGIPQIAIATHVDETCDEIEEDIKNIYKSTALKKKMTEFSIAVGIPLNCIMGVKNYTEETDNDEDMDVLILTALKHMVNFGDDFINKKFEPESSALNRH